MTHAFSILSAAALVLTGCGTSTTTANDSLAGMPESTSRMVAIAEMTEVERPPTPQYAFPGVVTETVESGEIDWSGNRVRATGTGVVDPNNPNRAQARLMAEQAAVAAAQRNLLETVQGVRVNSETIVSNFMTDYDVIYTRVEGIVLNTEPAGPARYDSLSGIVEVELEMEIQSPEGISGALNAALGTQWVSAAPMSDQTRDFLWQYSALVFDGAQAGLQPSMYPKIYDTGGNLLLDTSQYASCLGSAGQTAMQFISNLDQILLQPALMLPSLVVNVRQVTGQFGSDIILGSEESDSLGWLKAGLPFVISAGKFLLNVL
jgi:hypothetical protein